MRILVTGGTGFIGGALIPELTRQGHDILLLSRQVLPCDGVYPSVTSLDQISSSERIDAVINLAGASMAGQRWNTDYKRELVNSRIDVTKALVCLVERLETPPEVIVSASAIGYYGHHDDEKLREDSLPEAGFSQSLCQEWEDALDPAREAGIRVATLRLGVVLDAGGGAFEQMAGSFRLGVGTWLGSGRQWLSWIHRRDVVAAISYVLSDANLSGPFNVCAPEPVTSRDFARVLSKHYFTLASIPVPAFAARLLVGEMADELLLRGQRVIPQALQDAGFAFRYPTLDQAVAAIR
ncbi:TIGR01777 family protein [Halioglobus maricola]|uniref:TIGR01777 family protein n=1 Tax=Halioglobus maricola TaxID=2601894 RepID=A0A5P9NMG5_9GAMM|nr:TIGR01777 family oxidoreductase [Halioglobus maricola]QFU76118.1 TIGR01777 family protein [Halioglobus maricola]